MCVLKGSSVDISCTYAGRYYVISPLWFSPKQSGRWRDTLIPEDLTTDPGYAGRVEYPDQESRRYSGPFTLRITDLREEDSAEYRFTFKTDNFEWGHSFPGTTLTVTDIQVKVTPATVTEGQNVTLTCITSCPLTGNTTYIWYKNGQQIDESSSPQYKDSVTSNYDDSYSCSVKGHEDLHSSTVCVQGQTCRRVTYNKRRICVLKGSSVDISCTYVGGNSVTSSLWFSPKQSGWWRDELIPEDLTTDPEYAGRVEFSDQESRRFSGTSILRITDLRDEDSAEYRFTFKTNTFDLGHGFPGTTLTVTGLQVEVSPEGWSYWKTLTCITSCHLTGNPTYIWYKNGLQIDESSFPQYKDPVPFNFEDSYSCSVKGHEDLQSPTVCVMGQYCNRVIYTQRRICVLKGSSVDISCTYVGRNNVTSPLWFSPKQSGRWRDKLIPEDLITDPRYAGRVEYPDQESRRYRGPFTLRITDLREEDSAEYRFTFKTYNVEWSHSLPGTTLTVTDVQVKMSPATVTKGQNVTLTCITSCPLTGNTTYIWYKKTVTSPKASGQSYSITNITSEDSGEYYCEVRNGRGSKNSSVLMVNVAGTRSVGIKIVVLVLILCLSGFIWFRRKNASISTSSDNRSTRDTEDKEQSVHPDPNSDMYTTLNMRNRSPEYDTLDSVHPDTNSDMYSSLNMRTRSPDYDTLVNARLLCDTNTQIHTETSVYENCREPPQNLD
uniref:Ig-like domain-containing protein n=1 Tax=Esox lucius TaxID=8010 RepID=A0A6Q2YZM8_ESOLU